jgi:predicted O-methyltransferase YrrM
LIDEIPAGDLDVCFIDGEHRGACANEVVPKLRSGGMLIIDDAHGVLDHPTTSPHSRYGRGPAAPDWVSLLESVAGWRMIWTSDGFSDCAIWFKP